MQLPDMIENETQLDDLLGTPSPELVQDLAGFRGTVAVIGAGGKIGGTLARRMRRALDAGGSGASVIGVSRFSDDEARASLEADGISTVAADVLDESAMQRLPDADRVVYLAGRKFGTTGAEAQTWALSALAPVAICRRYAGRPIVAYSTGAVYDLVPVSGGGSREDDPLVPRGEYANAAVARERIFEWASEQYATPICQIRLYYANDLRYGVIRDIADSVHTGRPIDLSMGYVNLIWQGDAVDQSLRAFGLASNPPAAINVTGSETVSVRLLAERLGELLGRVPQFTGTSASDALLGNTKKAQALFGPPSVPLEAMIRWTAAWVRSGGRGLGKPTHWEVRDGRY